jgi:hypothetical protein
LAYPVRVDLADGRRHKVHAPELVHRLVVPSTENCNEGRKPTMPKQNVKRSSKGEAGQMDEELVHGVGMCGERNFINK